MCDFQLSILCRKWNMQKNKNIKIIFDSPVALTLVLCCLILFIFCKIMPQNVNEKILAFFSTPIIKQNGKVINFFNFSPYLKLFLHIFAHANFFSLFLNLSIILLLAPQIENLYGSRLFFLMILIASLVSGVLAFCFVPFSLQGTQSVCFLLIVLYVFNSIKKHALPLSAIILLILFVIFSITAGYGGLAQIVNILGGFCSSLFGIIPKETGNSKKSKVSSIKMNKFEKNEKGEKN